MGFAWSKHEIDYLCNKAGDVPFNILCMSYNAWADKHNYKRRTPPGIQYILRKEGVSRTAFGDWIRVSDVAKLTGISTSTIRRWGKGKSGLKMQKITKKRHSWNYIKRENLVNFIRENPSRFAGLKSADLLLLLEDEKLVDYIRGNCKSVRGRKSRVRCLETGRVYESIAAAGRSTFLSPRRIQDSLRRGVAAGGLHWQRC